MKNKATLSPCRTYRYWLERCWAPDPACMKGYISWIMLNPSTADAEVDDATIRKCIGFTKRWGYDGLVVVNLFAFRSTDPRKLRTAPDPVGPINALFIEASVYSAEKTIVAWGGMGNLYDRAENVAPLLDPSRTFALGVNADGSPKHPLYVGYDAQLVAWPARVAQAGDPL